MAECPRALGAASMIVGNSLLEMKAARNSFESQTLR